MATWTETDCTYTHDGRTYEESGAFYDGKHAIAYVKDIDEDAMRYATFMSNGTTLARRRSCTLTDWHGNKLADGRITARWHSQSFMGMYLYQIEATIDSVTYTGRSHGNGTIWNARAKASRA